MLLFIIVFYIIILLIYLLFSLMIFILFCLLFPCNNNNVCETDFVSINYVTKNIKYRKKKRNKNVKISLTLIQV